MTGFETTDRPRRWASPAAGARYAATGLSLFSEWIRTGKVLARRVGQRKILVCLDSVDAHILNSPAVAPRTITLADIGMPELAEPAPGMQPTDPQDPLSNLQISLPPQWRTT